MYYRFIFCVKFSLNCYVWSILGAFAALRKATVSLVCLSVCLSACQSESNKSAPTGWIFMKLYVYWVFENLWRKFKLYENNGYFTWKHIFLSHLSHLVTERKTFQIKVVEKIKTNISCPITFLCKIVPFMR